MNISISVRDGISPDLAKKIAKLKDARPVLQTMAQTLVERARRSWDEPAMRPAAWPARKKDTGKKLLWSSGALRRGTRVVKVTNAHAEVGSDRPYAAVHQYGSRKKRGRGGGIPPRPYWPITGGAENPKLTPKAEEAVASAAQRRIDAMLDAQT